MSLWRILEGLIAAVIAGVVILVVARIPHSTLLAFLFDCHTIISFTVLLQLLALYRFQYVSWQDDREGENFILPMIITALMVLEWWLVMNWDEFCTWCARLAE